MTSGTPNSPRKKKFRDNIALVLLRTYPKVTTTIIALLTVASLADAVGLAALLPLLFIVSDPSKINQPGITGLVTKLITSSGIPISVWVFVGFIAAAMTLKAILTFGARIYSNFAVAAIGKRLRLELVSALLSAEWSYYVGRKTGALSNALSLEAFYASEAFRNVFSLATVAINAIFYGSLSFFISPQIALASVVAGLALYFLFAPLIRMARRAGTDSANAFNRLSEDISEAIQSVKPLRAMSLEHRLVTNLGISIEALRRAINRATIATQSMESFREPVIVAFLSGGIAILHTLQLADLEEMIVLAFLFHRTVMQVGKAQTIYQALARNEAFYYRFTDLTRRAKERAEVRSGSVRPLLADSIVVSGVDIKIQDQPILTGINATIPAGRTTVLIGPSGAGKTTLVDVILGLYLPEKGEVLIDGIPLVEVDLSLWRNRIGYVPQETILFHDTILYNVTLETENIEEHRVWRALKLAGISTFVSGTQDQLHTVVGERGSRLSGGQRQRIAIARALYREPLLLILDEPTASLDPHSAEEIRLTLRQLSGETTVLLVTHDPSLVQVADTVIEVRDGRIESVSKVEHEQLSN